MNKKRVLSIIIVALLLVCITTISAFATTDSYASISEAFSQNIVVIIIVAIIGGVITVVISIKAAKKKITTAVRQTVANNYVVDGSFQITKANDIYLYTTTTRTPRNTNNKR